MTCPTCSSDDNPLGIGIIDVNHKLVPCPDCNSEVFQPQIDEETFFDWEFQPQTDEEMFRAANIHISEFT